jgi:hypothetical protein
VLPAVLDHDYVQFLGATWHFVNVPDKGLPFLKDLPTEASSTRQTTLVSEMEEKEFALLFVVCMACSPLRYGTIPDSALPDTTDNENSPMALRMRGSCPGVVISQINRGGLLVDK